AVIEQEVLDRILLHEVGLYRRLDDIRQLGAYGAHALLHEVLLQHLDPPLGAAITAGRNAPPPGTADHDAIGAHRARLHDVGAAAAPPPAPPAPPAPRPLPAPAARPPKLWSCCVRS